MSKRSGTVVAGHARIEAARLLGETKIPVDYQVFASEFEEHAYLLADNRIAELAERDNAAIKDLLEELDTGATDMDLTGFTEAAIESLMTQVHQDEPAQDDKPEGEKPTGSDLSEDNQKLAAFIARREASKLRGKDKGEVNFWLCLVFQSWAQKQEFLARCPDLETRYGMYCDGEAFAAAVGKPVTPNEQKPITPRIDKNLEGMAQ